MSNESYHLQQEKGVVPTIAMPELPVEETVVEQQEVVEQEAAPEEQIETPVQKEPTDSFKELREKALQAARERDELLNIVKELKQQVVPSQTEPEVDELGLKPDDLAEGKHLTKVQKEIYKLKQELNNYKKQSYESIVEAKLKSQYSDFDKVVSPENIKTFSMIYPEIAETLNSSADLYNKAVSAYTMIKKLGIYQEDSFMADKKKAKENSIKPRTVTSLSPQQGDSPLSKANAFANGLTPELQKQLRKEMEDAIKSR